MQHLRVQRIACLYQNDAFGTAAYGAIVDALAYVGMKLVAEGPAVASSLPHLPNKWQ
jgi:ABC-type branched-subunit amino acid transport system substrate-binding protein